jgi:hypothetical protein
VLFHPFTAHLASVCIPGGMRISKSVSAATKHKNLISTLFKKYKTTLITRQNNTHLSTLLPYYGENKIKQEPHGIKRTKQNFIPIENSIMLIKKIIKIEVRQRSSQ